MPESLNASHVADGLSGVVARLHYALRRAGTGLPDAQVGLLRLVERHPGVSVKEAAELLGIAANTVSTLVGELAGAGLLTRTRDPGNRRVVRLDLTAEARRQLAEYAARRRAVLAEALAGLDPPALADLDRALAHLRRIEDLVGRRLGG
ncbi:MAG: MarR family transcriptional regulator [Micromonosporaceae bacterium]|jgi:DNA-binding MarR family transcriptional regulator|nr:MarR family transcriptional regulator [Micromonosporaceae bacterium]